MNWERHLVGAYETRSSIAQLVRPAFHRAASDSEISRAEETLRCRLPRSLRFLLLQTNGVTEELQIENDLWIESGIVVYSVEEMIDANLYVRQAYPERNADQYCYFSTAGTDGIQFGLRARLNEQDDAAVFAWYPDQTREKRMADGLAFFLRDWCAGQATV